MGSVDRLGTPTVGCDLCDLYGRFEFVTGAEAESVGRGRREQRREQFSVRALYDDVGDTAVSDD
jgi:hypothetical protein